MMEERFKHLIRLYNDNQLSESERSEFIGLLEQQIEESMSNEQIEHILEETDSSSLPSLSPDYSSEEMLSTIFEIDKSQENNTGQESIKKNVFDRKRIVRYGLWAACIAILLGIFIHRQIERIDQVEEIPALTEIAPPLSNEAFITFQNGSKVDLSTIKVGETISHKGFQIVKLADGQISYQPESASHSNSREIHTVSNPRGSQPLKMKLSDGSSVLLNANSSIKFPAYFEPDHRNVSIAGEAYFEISHDATRPFLVDTKDVQVKVLGTRFNLYTASYDANAKVTLLEGKVEVTKESHRVVLNPGQQAQVSKEGISVQKVIDMDKVMAWKEGLFNFDHVGIEEAISQLENWYGVSLRVEGTQNTQLRGSIGRDLSLQEVMEGFKAMGLTLKVTTDK